MKYCSEIAAPIGSTFYYSTRQFPLAKRNAAIAIQAFYQELEKILFDCKEVAIAQTKFQWWRIEVEKIHHGKPDHPVAFFLQKYADGIASEKLIELINGVEETIVSMPFSTFEDVMVHFMRTAGARELLIANMLEEENETSHETIYQLAFVVEFVNYIQHLRKYVRNGLIYFSADELDRFQAEWNQYKTTTAIKNLLAFQAEKIKRAYDNAEKKSSFKNLLIRANISLVLLNEIQESGFTVLENFIDLTAIRKWWIARKLMH